ncbi:unnamed protein product [Boreogadus saida]
MDEEREEGGPTSKTPLSGDHGRQIKSNSPEQQERADSPGPSCVSMKRDRSMTPPGRPTKKQRQHQERSKVTSARTVQQHQTKLIKRAKERAHAFPVKKLKGSRSSYLEDGEELLFLKSDRNWPLRLRATS